MFQTDLKSELEIIEDLKAVFELNSGRIGIGDDAAVIEHNQLISTDAFVEGVHFIQGRASWEEVAYKLFASNASDMAAMGGFPTGYTLALSIPKYWNNRDLKAFILGIRMFLHDFPADLLGGDTISSDKFFASVTVIGKSYLTPWLRSTAKEGDFIYCTGTLGDSKLWLDKELETLSLPMKDHEYFRRRHYKPTPRIKWASILNKYKISAALDISDGLIEDLQKLCHASNVSFYIDGSSIPISINEIGVENYQEHRIFYQKAALIGGEDYELLFTSSEVLDEKELLNHGVCVSRIGRILPQSESSLILWNNKRFSPHEFQGFRHL